MTEQQGPRIIVGVDGSPSSRVALSWAASLASFEGVGLKAVLAWRYPLAAMPGAWGPAPAPSDMAGIGKAALDAMVDDVVGEDLVGEHVAGKDPVGEPPVERVVRQGSPSYWLMEESEGADLLVTGRRGSGGLLGIGFGSTSRQVAAHAELPVAVVGEDVEPLGKDPVVVVAVDGSDHSVHALVWAMQHLARGRPVTAVYSHDEWILDDILDDTELAQSLERKAQNRLADVADDARAAIGGRSVMTFTALEVCLAGVPLASTVIGRREESHRIDLRVVRGDPRTTVWDVASELEADVVVVGGRGRTGLKGAVLGSFTTHAAQHCPADVALIVVP